MPGVEYGRGYDNISDFQGGVQGPAEAGADDGIEGSALRRPFDGLAGEFGAGALGYRGDIAGRRRAAKLTRGTRLPPPGWIVCLAHVSVRPEPMNRLSQGFFNRTRRITQFTPGLVVRHPHLLSRHPDAVERRAGLGRPLHTPRPYSPLPPRMPPHREFELSAPGSR